MPEITQHKVHSSTPRKRKRGQDAPTLKSKEKRYQKHSQILNDLEKKVADMEVTSTGEPFANMPLSEQTQKGLKKAFFVNMTDIQAKSLPHSLQGKDVLGAARTGSGKTLAFLVPVLEFLLRKKWGPQDGLGALIISPTRELAMQIFDVLRAVGIYHTFSAGLVIGGKNLKDESDRVSRMNILVATPGRLLQHLDQTIGFNSDNLQILVLDEADRILDMGFAKSMNAILAHLPSNRQTLLFSATQTDSVQDLARLSLKDPVFVGVKEENHDSATPKGLEQHYIICDLHRKLDTLFSFIKTHLQSKTLIFFSTCKQVRFAFETFCKLQPGVPLMHLHGKQKQSKRLEIFQKFTTTKNAFLFATDIAARGLDFPAVDWVVQLDAPEDAETYIHRVGRTARYQSQGKALLFLLPTEEDGMLAALEAKNIDIQKIKVKQSQTTNIQSQLQSFAFQDPDIKYLGQRAFISYLRSIYLQKDKNTFKLDSLPIDEFAEALGLPGTPRVKFLSRELAKQKKNASRQVEAAISNAAIANNLEESNESSSDDDGEVEETKRSEKGKGLEGSVSTKPTVRTKYDRMFERKNQKLEHYRKVVEESVDAVTGTANGNDSDAEDFLTIKRVDHALPEDLPSIDPQRNPILGSTSTNDLSKRKLKIGQSKKLMAKYRSHGEKLIFDEDGTAHQVYETKNAEQVERELREKRGLDVVQLGKEFAEEQRGVMKEIDAVDKAIAKEKKREKKRKAKERERGTDTFDESGPKRTIGSVAYLQDPEDDGYVSPVFNLPENDGDSSDKEDHRPSKKRKLKATTIKNKYPQQIKEGYPITSLEQDEALALTVLRGNRH